MTAEWCTWDHINLSASFVVLFLTLLVLVCFHPLNLLTETCSVAIEINALEHFHVVLFISLYELVQTVESVDKMQNCDHLNESY